MFIYLHLVMGKSPGSRVTNLSANDNKLGSHHVSHITMTTGESDCLRLRSIGGGWPWHYRVQRLLLCCNTLVQSELRVISLVRSSVLCCLCCVRFLSILRSVVVVLVVCISTRMSPRSPLIPTRTHVVIVPDVANNLRWISTSQKTNSGTTSRT